MAKSKKPTEPKQRAEVYEPKVSIKADFNTALNILAQQANKVVKERQSKIKK